MLCDMDHAGLKSALKRHLIDGQRDAYGYRVFASAPLRMLLNAKCVMCTHTRTHFCLTNDGSDVFYDVES